MVIRLWGDTGFCFAWHSGTFWFRRNGKTYFARAPWHEPLFSERYIHKPKSYFGWRFYNRSVTP